MQHPRLRQRTRMLACTAALLAAATPAAHAEWQFAYKSQPLTCSVSPGYATYGSQVVATVTLADDVIDVSFTGLRGPSSFSAYLGTDTYPLVPAGAWCPPAQPLQQAFLSFADGRFADGSFGASYAVQGNTIVIGSTGRGESIRPFPRVVFWGLAGTPAPGVWTLLAAPVPEPGHAFTVGAGLLVLGGLARWRRTRSASRASECTPPKGSSSIAVVPARG